MKGRLKKLIREKAIIETKEEVVLASGRTSRIFFDLKRISLDPEGAGLIAECLLEKIRGCDVKYVGGLESGAIPLVSSLSLVSWKTDSPLNGFFVRKKVKERGTRNLIEGNFKEGARVVLIEDVTTTGNSVLKAVEAVEDQGCEVVKVLTVIDREEGAIENMKEAGIVLDVLFLKSEIVEISDEDEEESEEDGE